MASHPGELKYGHSGMRVMVDAFGLLLALIIIGFVDLTHFSKLAAEATYTLMICVAIFSFYHIPHVLRHRNDIIPAENDEQLV